VTVKRHYVTRKIFQINVVLSTFYSSKNPEKSITFYTKISSSTTVFNFDNDTKCFLSTKSAYYNDFWRIMWHWRFRFAIREINYILKKNCNNTVLFKLIFHNIGEYKVFQHQTFELLCTLYMCYEFCDALVNIIWMIFLYSYK